MSGPPSTAIVSRSMLLDQSKSQCSGDRRRLDKFDRNRIAKAMRCRSADEGAAGLVEAEIFPADIARRDEAVSTGLIEFDKEPGAGHPRNMGIEQRADPVGKEMRDQPIGSFAFGLHGAALGDGNICGDLGKCTRIRGIRQSIVSK